jgi:AraC-like DNA-binding protein
MKYQTIPPSPKLAQYVRCFWVYEGEASAAHPYVYRAYASGCAELVFHYRSPFDQLVNGQAERSFAAAIHAQARKHSRFVVHQNWGIFGCYLYPFALPRLFSFPASDFTDRETDFQSVLGREGRELEERMLMAGGNDRRLQILSHFLENRLANNQREEPLVFASIAHIINRHGLVSVRDLARENFLSHRQFERKFKEFSGLPPKLFARISRFQAALKEYGRGKSLTAIAYDYGYFDQSHFINDFKEFSGYNPKVFFKGQAEGSEYLDC